MRGLLLLAGLSIGTRTAVRAQAAEEPDTGEHPDWPRWCGKVYEAGYPSFEPGGHTTEPASNGSTFLHMQFRPRYSLYLAGVETRASFVVNAALSPWFGEPYANATTTTSGDDDGGQTRTRTGPFTELAFSINLVESNAPLVKGRIAVNATGVEFGFDLAALTPRLTPYEVVLSAAPAHGDHSYTATSTLLYLPDNAAGGGSATKIDNLRGGLLFRDAATTGGAFAPLLPYGYYGLYGGSNDTAAADAWVRDYTSGGKGLNAIIALAGFADTNPVYDSMDAQGLRFMFDLRGSYKNLTETETRVNTIKHHSSLFAYWTADEPDGWQVPFAKTPAAQSLIHALDPYHPVAITLNCQDYYFAAYSAGGDVLMADVYPIGINATFSSKWGTPCNATLGDCGCDNCAGAGARDVAARLDDLARHERRAGAWPKPKLHNPQAFHGEGYWARDPTPAEARAMNALALARGAAGLFAWTWPAGSPALFAVHSDMAAVVAAPPVRDFLLGREHGPLPLRVEGLSGIVDAACWVRRGGMLVSVVNGGYEDVGHRVAIALPVPARDVEAVVFGGLPWQLRGGELVIDRLPGMSTSFVILNVEMD